MFPWGIQQSSSSDLLLALCVSGRHSCYIQQGTSTCLFLRPDHLSALGFTAQMSYSCIVQSGLSITSPSSSTPKQSLNISKPSFWVLKENSAGHQQLRASLSTWPQQVPGPFHRCRIAEGHLHSPYTWHEGKWKKIKWTNQDSLVLSIALSERPKSPWVSSDVCLHQPSP